LCSCVFYNKKYRQQYFALVNNDFSATRVLSSREECVLFKLHDMKKGLRSFLCLLFVLISSHTLTAQLIYTFAGNGNAGYTGDGGAPGAAELNAPFGIAVDGAGNVYIADNSNSVIRKVSTTGIITTVAGNGTGGFSGDGGAATAAMLQSPTGVAVDASGNIYIADAANSRIRKVNTSGIITTIAGTGTPGYTGDGGAATAATVNSPVGVAVDGSGNIYIADYNNNVVRMINTSGDISTFAGTGTSGFGGDGGAATAALLALPTAMAIDASGNVYISDQGNNRVRMVNTSGVISTFAGIGTPGFSGDLGLATAAELLAPNGILIDGSGNLLIADQNNNRIRQVTTLGIIATVAGTGTSSYSGDGGSALLATLNTPMGLGMDGAGNIFIADYGNNVVRVLSTDIAPSFVNGPLQGFVACSNASSSINSLLGVSDVDPGQTETWTVLSGPLNGALAGLPATVTSTGGTVTPSGLSYTPASGYSGTDVFTIQVSDGIATSVTTITATVNPTPNVTAPSSQAVCNGAATAAVVFTGTVTGTVYSWANNNTSIGLASTGTGNIASFTAVNTSSVVATAIVTVTPTANGCTGAAQTFTVTVNPTPTVVAPSNQTVCNGNPTNAVNFTGTVAGTTYTWTNSNTSVGLASSGTGNIAAFTAVNSTSVAATAVVTVSPSANSCTGTAQTFTITVNPTPTMTTPSGQAVCNGAATSAVNFTGAATSYLWTNSNAGIGLASSGTGNIASFTAINTTSAVATATITVTPSANFCLGAQQNFVITVNPTPTVVIPSNQSLCNGSTTTAANFSGPVSGTIFNWTNSNTSIGLGATGSGNIPSFTGVNTSSLVATATIFVTPFANGCLGSAQGFTITVNPIPSVVLPANITACAWSASGNINFAGPVSGTTYTWTNDNTSIGLASTGTGSITSFTVTNTTNVAAIAVVTVTPSANGCVGSAQSFTITVKPMPEVDTPSSQVVCNGAATAVVSFSGPVSGTTYLWVNNNTSIGLASTGSGNIASFTAINTSSVVSTAAVSVTPFANGCMCSAKTFTISVNPTPTVVVPSSQTICNGAAVSAINFTGAVLGTTYAWTNTNTSIGLASTGSGNIASFTALNTSSVVAVAVITVTPSANSCIGTAQTFTITVNPTPSAVMPSSQAVCNGSATAPANFSGPVAGSAYSWTNNNTSIGLAAMGTGNISSFTATNSTNAIVTATINVTPSANSCTGTSQNFTITVNPTPNVIIPSDQTVCNNAMTATLVFTGSVSGTTYTWVNSDANIGLTTTGSGNIASFMATNVTSGITIATVSVTPAANGCTAATPQDFTITVFPTPDVVLPASQTVCDGGATAAVNFTGSVSGTAYNWTNNNTSIGLAANGAGDITSFMATNNTNVIANATIMVTPFANGCMGMAQSFTITVNPTPTIAAISPASQTLCNNDASAAINFTGAVSGSSFTWTNSNTSIGLAANGSGNIASFIATNFTSGIETATITVTPDANACGTGVPQSFTIVVNPTPDVAMLTSQTVCDGLMTTPVNFSGMVSGTGYSWTNDNTSIGLIAAGTGDIGSFIATNGTNLIANAVIVVTPIANGCMGVTQTFTITVNPTPTIAAITPAGQVLCNNAASAAVNFTGSVSGSTFTWTNSNTSIGLAANGSGDILSFTAINGTNAIETATITVTPDANACGTGIPQSFTIVVNPTPDVAVPASQTVCDGSVTTDVIFTGSVAGTTYNWTNNNTSIGLPAAGSGDVAAFIATNNTNAAISATVTVTALANGCMGTPQSFTITVNPTPNVAAISPANLVLCNGDVSSAVNFTGTVTGSTFTWTNSNTTIGLAASGSGDIVPFTATNFTTIPQTAFVTVTPDANACGSGIPQIFTIVVNPTPDVAMPANQILCDGAMTVSVNFTGSVTGTTYNWTNNNTSIGLAATGVGNIPAFMATNTTNAITTATITITPIANGCTGTPQSFTIAVNPTPMIATVTPGNQVLCNGAVTAPVNFTGSVTGSTFTWTNNNTSIGLAASGAGSIASFTATNATASIQTATITVTPDANACATGIPKSFTIAVNPTPDLVTPSGQSVCNGFTTVPVTFIGSVSGTTYAWMNSNTSMGLAANGMGNIGSFTVINNSNIPQTAVISVTPSANGCFGTMQSFVILAKPTPSVVTPVSQAVCNGAPTANVNFVSPVAGATYSWTNSNASIGLAPSGAGDIMSFTTVNSTSAIVAATITVTPDANGCTGPSENFMITVNPTPDVMPVAGQVVCAGGATVPVAFGSSVSGASFTWVNSNAGIGLAASGAGNIGSFTAINATSAPVTATISVMSVANGCVSASPLNFSITVNPVPDVTVSAPAQAVCNGAATTAINFTGSVSGTSYSWVNSDPSIGLAATGSGDITSFTAANSTNTTITAIISVTPSASGCMPGAPQNFTITVYPTPDVSVMPNLVLCNGADAAPAGFNGSVSGTVYTWTNSDASIGLATSGMGSIASFSAINTTVAPVTATITVMPSFNSCSGTPQNFTITVNPTPVLNSPLPVAVCNSTMFSYTSSSATAGTTFTWSRAEVAGISNPAASGSGDINEVLVNISSFPITVVYVDTLRANGCTNTETISVIVNPLPVLSSTLTPPAVCNNTMFSYVPASDVTGATFSWSRAVVPGISNPAASGNDNPNEVLINTTALDVAVTYTYVITANGCSNAQNVVVAVHPTPMLSSSLSLTNTVCNNVAFTYTPSSGTPFTLFNWSRAAVTGITLAAANGIGGISEILTNNLPAPVKVVYVYTMTANGCMHTQSVTLWVNPAVPP
jgi:hypothetical protein